MTFAVITENDKSDWDDETGIKYHFPNRYLKLLQPDTRVIYYNGSMKDKSFLNRRLSREPHYFGFASIGKITPDSSNDKLHYYAEIENFQEFSIPVISKYNGTYLEHIPPKKQTNYWRDGVRQIDKDVYDKIISLAGINVNTGESVFNDNEKQDNSLVSALEDGGKKLIYSTRYERNQVLRMQAISIHGLTCKGCGMNFRDFYGEWGQGYIHVHHKKPIASFEGKEIVNPYDDLTVLCANCHAMIHRRKDAILSVDDLKNMIENARPHLST